MKKRIIAKILCTAVLFLALSPGLAGCTAASAKAPTDLMSGLKPIQSAGGRTLATSTTEAVQKFSVELFRRSVQGGENVLVSPLSVLMALAMTANGADGETLTQMETVFGCPISELNPYFQSYLARLSSEEMEALRLANGIWFRDSQDFTVSQSFLQANANYYGASAYQAAFDEATCREINRWVQEHTDNLIEKLLDQMPADAVMCLANALAFNASWEEPYEETQVQPGEFTTAFGQAQSVTMLYSEEDAYLENEEFTGFLKYYEGGAYAFAGLLPREGGSLGQSLDGLTGEKLQTMLEELQQIPVDVMLPEFKSEYTVKLQGLLAEMGMPDAFDPLNADFSRMSDGQSGLYVGEVLHKTVLSLDAHGTKAAAVTGIQTLGSAAPSEETKTVHLDRPFVYLILDCETNLPIFMGTVMEIPA